MRKKEFPESIEETKNLMDELTSLAEKESDKDRRRELFLLKIELRDHIIHLGLNKQKKRSSLKQFE